MANVVFNEMRVSGPDTEKFLKGFEEKGFEDILPMPKELENEPSPICDPEKETYFLEKYGAKDWYDWAIKNWGCKWNADNIHINDNFVMFQTPWSPPIEWALEATRVYDVEIELYYEDEGYCFAGESVFKDGEEIKLEVYDDMDEIIEFLIRKKGVYNVVEDFYYVLDELYDETKDDYIYEIPYERAIDIIKTYFEFDEEEAIEKFKEIKKELLNEENDSNNDSTN